jgi:hypothetical protein
MKICRPFAALAVLILFPWTAGAAVQDVPTGQTDKFMTAYRIVPRTSCRSRSARTASWTSKSW